jgi:hypothetical protein
MFTKSSRAQAFEKLLKSAPLPLLIKGGAVTGFSCWEEQGLVVQTQACAWTGEVLTTKLLISNLLKDEVLSSESALLNFRRMLVAELEQSIENRRSKGGE